jgi:hypothetical protein
LIDEKSDEELPGVLCGKHSTEWFTGTPWVFNHIPIGELRWKADGKSIDGVTPEEKKAMDW